MVLWRIVAINHVAALESPSDARSLPRYGGVAASSANALGVGGVGARWGLRRHSSEQNFCGRPPEPVRGSNGSWQ
jgi:hypothetical protein